MKQELDPGAARVVEMLICSAAPAPEAGTPAQMRESFRKSRAALAPALPAVASVQTLSASGPGGPIPCRIYRGLRTAESDRLPVFLFFHSGGWVAGSLETHDSACRAIATLAHCAVLAVDYRLAPEHPFPAAVEDVCAAYNFVVLNAERLRIDAGRIAVGGDSAGANLAAVLAISLRDGGDVPPVLQVLLYPATDFTADTVSLREFGEGPTLTRRTLDWFAHHYLGNQVNGLDWRASPLRAPRLDGLPPAFLVTCGFDPLRDEGEAYGDQLEKAGVNVTRRPFAGQIHGFLTMAGVIPEATILLGEVAAALDRAFYRRPIA